MVGKVVGNFESDRLTMEREKGFEPSTSTLARLHSTTELLPQWQGAFLATHRPQVKPASASPPGDGDTGRNRKADHPPCSGSNGASAAGRPGVALPAPGHSMLESCGP